MIACNKSWRNDPHLSSGVRNVAASVGYPVSWTVAGRPIWLAMSFAIVAVTPTVSLCPAPPTADKQRNALISWSRVFDRIGFRQGGKVARRQVFVAESAAGDPCARLKMLEHEGPGLLTRPWIA